jgi:hypothetical protein
MEDGYVTFMTMVFPVERAGPTFHAHMRTISEREKNEKDKFFEVLLEGLTREVPCVITPNETKISRKVFTETHME